jgi:hypothetical protein
MHNTKAVTDLVKRLSKPGTAVRHVQLGEAKQGMFLSPLPNGALLNPMAGDYELSINVISLPCVACQADFAAHGRALKARINSRNEGR